MIRYKRNLILDVFDYSGHKRCTLYDNSSDVSGQATDVFVTTERNGWRELTFNLPSVCDTPEGQQDNYRLEFLKADYKIRLIDDDGIDWFLISEPKVTHNNFSKNVGVTAGHIAQLLKTKNLSLEFSDDEGNNVGTAAMLLDTILEGTGWKAGNVSTFYENDGKTLKYRSLKASAKTGAFKLISNMCDLFEAKPIYHGNERTVDIVPINPFSDPGEGNLPDVTNADGVIELHYGKNVSNVTRTLNTENMVTKLYAYGAYGDKTNGYCGIDECKHTEYTFTPSAGIAQGTECYISVTDKTGITAKYYFIAEVQLSSTDKLIWSDLDPASKMYVWDNDAQKAYLLYRERTTESPIEIPLASLEETQNWFSFVMDFDYYNTVGLMNDEMLQNIATYQRRAPRLMKNANDAAADLAEAQTQLAETIGSVNFCRLNVASYGVNDGYRTIVLNKTNSDGTLYRTDYDVKKDKQFTWRVATEIKDNGDAKNDEASVIYVVHEKSPKTWDKVWLKNLDDQEDPSVLTLWTTPTSSADWNPETDKIFLFQSNNVNGMLGAYESADEAAVTALESSTKNVTVDHPTYFQKTAPVIKPGELNGYGWWWKYYDDNTASEMYFYFSADDASAWHRVYYTDSVPGWENGTYYYNWKKGTLHHCENGEWIQKTSTSDKRIAALFGTVLRSCLTRDKYYKGQYKKYTYTATGSGSPAGNYAMPTGYGTYWVFTTTSDLASGDTLSYDTTDGWLTQTVNGTDTTIEVKNFRFDNVNYFDENICTNTSYERGSLNTSNGGEVDSTTRYRSGFMSVKDNVTYSFSGADGEIFVLYYDENRNYMSYVLASGNGDSIAVPNNVGYMRVTSMASLTNLNIHAVNYDSMIIANDESYFVLPTPVGSGELKGIRPLIAKFSTLADETYLNYYVALKNAQQIVKNLETVMKVSLDDIYREGYWQKNDYVDGDEDKLYDDAIENLVKISRPETKYTIKYLDLYGANDDGAYGVSDATANMLWPDLSTESAAHLIDPEIDVNCWAFIDKVSKCYDQPWKTQITINTELTTIAQHSFTDVMTHIAEVASDIKGKAVMYERAKAITGSGTMAAERLQGKIDANSLLITGGSSTWYTDDKGNMVFVSADGASAMTLTGNGFAIANSKNEFGDWRWRTFGTGDGFSADEIVTGYMSAERIEAGSITTDQLSSSVGESLDISSNKSVRLVVSNEVTEQVGPAVSAAIEIYQDSIVQEVVSSDTFYQAIDDAVGDISVSVGARNYIRESRHLIFENVHYANYRGDKAHVDYARVGLNTVG